MAEQPVVCNGCVVLNFVLASSRTQGGLRSDTCSRVKECKLSYEQGARGGDAEKLQLALALLNLVAARAGDPSVGGGGQRCTTRRASELLLERVIRSTVLHQIHRDLHVPTNLYLRLCGIAHRRVSECAAALGHTGIYRGAFELHGTRLGLDDARRGDGDGEDDTSI